MSEYPVHINQTLWHVLDSLQIKEDICSREIIKYWEKVLGPVLAGNSQFIGYHDNLLSIMVAHPTWQKEFQLLEKEIISKFNNELGARLVKKCRILTPEYESKVIPKSRPIIKFKSKK